MYDFFKHFLYRCFINGYPSGTAAMIYNSTTTRFSRYSNISLIFKQMMIEQLHSSISYQSFYESCAPKYCTYSHKMHTKNFLGVITTLLSMIGGVTISLRILTPHLVEIIVRLLKLLKKNRQQRAQSSKSWSNFLFQCFFLSLSLRFCSSPKLFQSDESHCTTWNQILINKTT